MYRLLRRSGVPPLPRATRTRKSSREGTWRWPRRSPRRSSHQIKKAPRRGAFFIWCCTGFPAWKTFPLYNGRWERLSETEGSAGMGDYVQRFMENQGPLGPHPKHYAGGWIEVICGSMFSGKTEELIRRVRRAQIARQKVQVFKPSIDVRYSQGQVASHNGALHSAVMVNDSEEIEALVEPDTTVVALDEAQFFDEGVVEL